MALISRGTSSRKTGESEMSGEAGSGELFANLRVKILVSGIRVIAADQKVRVVSPRDHLDRSPNQRVIVLLRRHPPEHREQSCATGNRELGSYLLRLRREGGQHGIGSSVRRCRHTARKPRWGGTAKGSLAKYLWIQRRSG